MIFSTYVWCQLHMCVCVYAMCRMVSPMHVIYKFLVCKESLFMIFCIATYIHTYIFVHSYSINLVLSACQLSTIDCFYRAIQVNYTSLMLN